MTREKTFCVTVPALFKCKIYVEAESIEEARQKIMGEDYDDMTDQDFAVF